MDQNQKQQAVEQLKNAGTVLITTVTSPTTDQLTAALGLGMMLKKMGKNVSTVITSKIPDFLGFLKAEKYLEDNLDSLRDFILSLDKNLADKLRYKVEGDEVRIFITPYHTKIAKEDIRFSQGDFNVDAVVVVGAVNRTDIDEGVMKQSRVLNETPVISVTYGTAQSSVGGIIWHDPQASSVSEMMVSVSEALQPGLLDEQSSNALLTGIIAATDHFSNPDTSPKVMTMAAQLMASGADQQMIMSELKSQVSGTRKAPEKSIAESTDSSSPVDMSSDETKAVADSAELSNKTSGDDHNMTVSHDDSDNSKPEPIALDQKPQPAEKIDPQELASDTFNVPAPSTPPQLSAIDQTPTPLIDDAPAAPAPAENNFAASNATLQIPTPQANTPSVAPPYPAPAVPNQSVGPMPEPQAPVVAPQIHPGSGSVNNQNTPNQDSAALDNARAAVEAAMSSQPSGTAMNPRQGMGAQDFADNSIPNPPQLTPNPMPPNMAQSSSQPFDQTGSTGVVGSVNPAQLYPDVDNNRY